VTLEICAQEEKVFYDAIKKVNFSIAKLRYGKYWNEPCTL